MGAHNLWSCASQFLIDQGFLLLFCSQKEDFLLNQLISLRRIRLRYFLLTGFLAILASASAAASDALDAAYISLEAKDQCVAFRWDKGSDADGRQSISVPVTIDGSEYDFMLDTGSDVSLMWGNPAGHDGESSFNPASMKVGTAAIDNPVVFIKRDMNPADYADQGTLGLQSLIGRVSVIDYPDREFCLFDAADVPDAIRAAAWSDATLAGNKLMIPISVGNFQRNDIIFDTGSSQLPLDVDLAVWRMVTGVGDPDQAPEHAPVDSWGKVGSMYGAPVVGGAVIRIGGVEMSAPEVFTEPDEPNVFADTYGALGLVGNVPFWDGIVVLDLSSARTFDNKWLLQIQELVRWQQPVKFGVIQ